MRTRTTQNPAAIPYGANHYEDRRTGNVTISDAPGTFNYYDSESQIEDETPQYRRTGSVNHVKIENQLEPLDQNAYDTLTGDGSLVPPYWGRYITPSRFGTRYFYPGLALPFLSSYLFSGAIKSPGDIAMMEGFSWPSVDISDKLTELQRSETKVNTLVNLVEAAHLKSLVKEAPKLARALYSQIRTASRLFLTEPSWYDIGKAVLKGSKEVSKDLSSSFLGYSFGIRPLISDIIALRRELINAEDSIRSTKARANKVHTWRDRTVSPQVADSYAAYGNPAYCFFAQRQWTQQPTTITSVRYIDDLYLPDSALADMAIMARRLGVLPSFEAAWELVPFSFLADWCVGIGQLAQLLDNKVSFLKKRRILEAATSRVYEYRRDYYSSAYWLEPVTTSAGYSTVRYYQRATHDLGLDSIPPGSGLGKMRGLLLAALLRQRDWEKPFRAAAKSKQRLRRYESAVRRLDRASPRSRVYYDLQQSYELLSRS